MSVRRTVLCAACKELVSEAYGLRQIPEDRPTKREVCELCRRRGFFDTYEYDTRGRRQTKENS